MPDGKVNAPDLVANPSGPAANPSSANAAQLMVTAANAIGTGRLLFPGVAAR